MSRERPPLPPGPWLVVGLARSGVAAACALAARGALARFQAPVHLILGGVGKGQDFTALRGRAQRADVIASRPSFDQFADYEARPGVQVARRVTGQRGSRLSRRR